MTNLHKHAEHELRLAGLFEPDAEYGSMVPNSVLRLIDALDPGDSGMSHNLTLKIFNIVANFKTLTPLTASPEEWNKVGDNMWQNRRNGSCFSTDEGKTYYDIDGDPDVLFVTGGRSNGKEIRQPSYPHTPLS